jgi:hypothetical protein
MRSKSDRTSLRRSLLAGILSVALLISCSLKAPAAGWTRGLPIGEVATDERKTSEPFVLEVWGGDDDHDLHGLCTYYNIKSVPFTIDGIETPDGDFYPNVSFQVADQQEKGGWRTISVAISRAGKPTILTIKPKSASKALKVDLDVYRPFIGKRQLGKLLLRTGESTVFQIDDLQPPEKKTESSADSVTEKK